MADVLFCRSRNSSCYWIVGDTNDGKKFVRKWFDTVPGYLVVTDLEMFIERATADELTVEVSG